MASDSNNFIRDNLFEGLANEKNQMKMSASGSPLKSENQSESNLLRPLLQRDETFSGSQFSGLSMVPSNKQRKIINNHFIDPRQFVAYTPNLGDEQFEIQGVLAGKRRKSNNKQSQGTMKSASKKRNLQDLFYSIRYNMYNNPTVNGLPEITSKPNIK